MADAAPSLGDFFKSKSKKKVKASNLNKDSTTKPEDTKKKTKETEDDTWQEEQVVASTIKVEVAGNLMREDEKKDEEDTAAPAWGDLRKNASSANQINEKRYPTLAKSVGSINIEQDEGKVNIKTSKNHFASLQGDSGSDEESSKRPKNIAPAMVSKKKGEFVKTAVNREVDAAKKDAKKKAKKADASDDEEDEEEEEEEAEEPAPAAKEEPKKKKVVDKKDDKKEDKKKAVQEEDAGAVAEDLKIQVDLVASKEKYKGRKKLPTVDLPAEEMEEKKETKGKQATQSSGGKKKKVFVEEETDKKLAYAEW